MGYRAEVKGSFFPDPALDAELLTPRDPKGYDTRIAKACINYARSVSYGNYVVENIKIWPKFGVHHAQVGQFLDVYCGNALSNPKYEIPRLMLPLALARPMSTGVFLGPSWYHNFYHWMIDIIPRLQLVTSELEQGTPLVVPGGLTAAQNEVLDLALAKIGLAGAEILRLSGAPRRFARLVMPTALCAPLDVSPTQRDFLRQVIPVQSRQSGSRLYVSRRDAAVRRIANEEDVVRLLKAHGFEVVTLAGRSVTEQAALFRGASVIVAHHGAGLTNLAFCEAGASVIEIFQRGHFSPSFVRLAQLGGLRYSFAVGEPVGADTWLDLDQLVEMLDRLGL